MANPIKKVKRDNNGKTTEIIVNHDGMNYYFTMHKGKIICTSNPRMANAVFSIYRKQLYAIFKKGKFVPAESIHKNIHQKEERKRLSILGEYKTFILNDGTIMIIRYEKGKNIPQYYNNIDSTIRGQDSIIKKYFGDNTQIGELDDIAEIFKVSDEVHNLLLNWNCTKKNDIEAGKAKLENVLRKMSQYRDKFKILSRKQIQKIILMKDSRGRDNPGALSARSNSSKNNLKTRIKKIISRRHLLKLEKKQIEANIMLATFRTKMILNSSDSFFKNQNIACRKINQILYLLQSVWVNPYSIKIKEVEKHLEKTRGEIRRGEIRNTKQHLEVTKNVLKAILI